MTPTPNNPNESAAETQAPLPASPWRIVWRRLKRHKLAMLGGIVLCVMYFMAIFAGFFAPYNYETQDRDRFFHPPTTLKFQGLWPAVPRYEQQAGQFKYMPILEDAKPIKLFIRGDKYNLTPAIKKLGIPALTSTLHLFGTGDAKHPCYLLGTDQFGRDILSRVLYGSQISLSIGVIGIALSFTLGVLVGGFSGYFGGHVDDITMRICEIIMSVPALYLILSLRATFPANVSSTQAYLMIVVILSFVRWAGMARVIRGMALSLRERQYVLAARALGQSHWKIVVRHIIPNTFSYIIVAATLSIPYYILGEVVLSVLSVGIQEPEASWGNMLEAARNVEYLKSYPWLLAPGAAIFITVLAFNFLGDGLRDAVDAKA